MNKIHYEKILPSPGESFSAELEAGATLDCVFHVHPEYELTLVESSFGSRFVGDSFEPFDAGELVLIGGMVPHHFLNSASDSTGPEWSKLRVVKFRRDFAGPRFWELPEFEPVGRLLDEAACGVVFPDAAASGATERIRRLFTLHGGARVAEFLALLALLAESEHRLLASHPAVAGNTGDERLARVLSRVHRNLAAGKPVTLDEAAHCACLTPPAFSKYFRAVTRKRFIDYVLELKLNCAAQELARTRKPVIEIAAAAGFGNLSNFNRQFLKRRGMTPREWRAGFEPHQY